MTQKRKFDAEVAKVLHLVIHSLYTNKDIFLRELVSNASDACDKLRYESQTNPDLLGKEGSDYKITVQIDKKNRQLVITDNGIGMNEADLIENLGTIAKSGTQGFLEALEKNEKQDVNLIGQFGVGFYSAFMIADKVEVKTKKAGEKQGYKWVSKGDGEYEVDENSYNNRGTQITLSLRKGEDEYLDKHKLAHIVKTYSDHIIVPVEVIDEDGNSEKANTGKALWTKSKSEVTEDEYYQFYKSISHQVDKPFMTIHGKAEGKLEYNYLLYIPTAKPFDLYHPDRMRRVKLFVKRVFIAEDTIDIIPRNLRFLRGVIDSEDLPLNISRESLQANPLVEKIKKSITTKILSELKKKASKERDKYLEFWKNFGPVLKEGLCETLDSKDPILEICYFNTTHGAELTNLDEYISRMKESQKEIYYLSGENLEALRNSPQIEGFAKRGIEVLLFNDTVDDFWVSVAHEYKDKQFKSVTRADIDLGEEKTEDKDAPKPEEDKTLDKLISVFQDELGEKVKAVKISKKLESSPVCLVVGEGDMDIRMERYLRDQKQLPFTSAKILEINPNHSLIKALAEKGDTAEVRNSINLLLDQAIIMEGETITDLKAFSERLNQVLQKAMAA